MNQLTNLQWKLIIPLAMLGLVRPLLSIFEVYERLEIPGGSILITFIIAAIWISVVLKQHLAQPLLTLVITSGLYGVFAIILQQLIWNFFLATPPASIPLIGYVSIIVVNLIWGAVLGLIATTIQHIQNRDKNGLSQHPANM